MEQKKPEICLIVAVHDCPDEPEYRGAIGYDGIDLFSIPADRKYFMQVTRGSIVIMGRETAEAIEDENPKYFPLKSRINIVATRDDKWNHPGVIVSNNLEKAIKYAQAINVEKIFIIGGGQIYNQVLAMGIVDYVYLTKILTSIKYSSSWMKSQDKSKLIFLKEYDKLDYEGEKVDFILNSLQKEEYFEDIRFQFLTLKRRGTHS